MTTERQETKLDGKIKSNLRNRREYNANIR